MTRRTYVYDRDLDAMVQIAGPETNHPQPVPGAGMHIIRDIEPYRTVAADTNGARTTIGGRRQHREFLQRNGYAEVGNETPVVPGYVPESRADRITDIRRAMGDFGSNVRD